MNPPATPLELATARRMSAEVLALVEAARSREESIERVAAGGFPAQALELMAFSLTDADLFDWLVECLKTAEPDFSAPEKAAFGTVAAWVARPSDSSRRAAEISAEEAGLHTAAGCAAMAVFMSSGSIAPADLEPVPPPQGVAAQLASVSLTLAAVRRPEAAASEFDGFIRRGQERLRNPTRGRRF